MILLGTILVTYGFVTMLVAVGKEEYSCAIAAGVLMLFGLGVLCYV